jgi:hypothetical protein
VSPNNTQAEKERGKEGNIFESNVGAADIVDRAKLIVRFLGHQPDN